MKSLTILALLLISASAAGAGSLTSEQQAVYDKLHYADFEAAKPRFDLCVSMDSFVSSGFTPTTQGNFVEIAADASGCIREMVTSPTRPAKAVTAFPREVLFMTCRRIASFKAGLPEACKSPAAVQDPMAQLGASGGGRASRRAQEQESSSSR